MVWITYMGHILHCTRSQIDSFTGVLSIVEITVFLGREALGPTPVSSHISPQHLSHLRSQHSSQQKKKKLKKLKIKNLK